MSESTTKRVERDGRLRWVPIQKMKTSPYSQRDINQARVDHLIANFDLEQIGAPTVNERDGSYYILDGQHRIEAIKNFIGEDQSVQCWVYVGLTEAEEAEKWLQLNDTLTPSAFDRFTKSVNAGRDVETDIDRIVRSLGMCVSRDEMPGSIRAVGTLRRVYTRSGPATLSRTLRIIRDTYGDPGLEAPVIDGFGHLCQRYNGTLNDGDAITRLSSANGAVNGLLGKAEKIRRETGQPKAHCVAAAAVEIINSGKGGKKLPSWWKADA